MSKKKITVRSIIEDINENGVDGYEIDEFEGREYCVFKVNNITYKYPVPKQESIIDTKKEGGEGDE